MLGSDQLVGQKPTPLAPIQRYRRGPLSPHRESQVLGRCYMAPWTPQPLPSPDADDDRGRAPHPLMYNGCTWWRHFPSLSTILVHSAVNDDGRVALHRLAFGYSKTLSKLSISQLRFSGIIQKTIRHSLNIYYSLSRSGDIPEYVSFS